MNKIEANSLALIIYQDKRYLKEVAPGKGFHGKGGILQFEDLIGKPYGISLGEYSVFEPTIEDIIMYGLRRETQIIFPKDSFYICYKLNLKCGSRVLEIGAGSGALTFLLSHTVGPEGHVVTLEKEERHYKNTLKNLKRFAPWDNVELHHQEATDYNGGPFDAVFIDVREPWLQLERAKALAKASASFGMIVPTANQISELLKGLQEYGFGDIEVLETMLRKYKTVAERVRPQDRMVAHTGYLVFARKLEPLLL